jgi:YfiR/HmsC-like
MCPFRCRCRRAARLMICCRDPWRRVRLMVVMTAIAVCAVTPFASAQITESALKAAFLHKFVKFVEWPAGALPPGQRLAMCIVGDAALAGALGRSIEGQAIDGHELTVTVLKPGDPASGCHLLYVSASAIKRSAGLLLNARSASIFTVSDAHKFAESGGMAQLIVENGRMRFTINIASAQRGRLNLSSKLLSVATIVKE